MNITNENNGEKSLQALFMEVNRHYAVRCVQMIAAEGIHPGQIPFLMILHNHDGCSQKEMAQRLEIKPPTVNVSIQRLEKNGIVYRKKDENDQRIMRVYLTEEGKKSVEGILREVKRVEKVMFGNFSEAELCLLRRFFRQILENIDTLPAAADTCAFIK